MNILLSAYHCAPNLGSESAVGWNYAVQLTKMNNKVVVITSDSRKQFFSNTNEHDQLGIEVIFFSLPAWAKRLYKPNTASEHLYYLFWQVGLFFFCKNILLDRKIELIHHVTLGSFRVPSFLWIYNVPFIFGPVGGGEDPPGTLLKNLKDEHIAKEKFRKWMNKLFVFSPFYILNLYKSKLILLKNQDTLKYIPKAFHHKCKIDIGIGVAPKVEAIELGQKHKCQKFKILYAGRLLYWKGVHLSIKAIAGLKEHNKDIEFTIVGSGPDEQWLKQLASQYQVQDLIRWVPKVEQRLLFQMYQDYDVLLFPSYHDSSGLVVVEAMSYGLPVICLDLGGPKEIVDSSCGIIVTTEGKHEEAVVRDVSMAISDLIENPHNLYCMRQQAMQKAGTLTWEKVVKRSYGLIQGALEKTYSNGSKIATPSRKAY